MTPAQHKLEAQAQIPDGHSAWQEYTVRIFLQSNCDEKQWTIIHKYKCKHKLRVPDETLPQSKCCPFWPYVHTYTHNVVRGKEGIRTESVVLACCLIVHEDKHKNGYWYNLN